LTFSDSTKQIFALEHDPLSHCQATLSLKEKRKKEIAAMKMDVQRRANSIMIRPLTLRDRGTEKIVKTKKRDVYIAYRFLVSDTEI